MYNAFLVLFKAKRNRKKKKINEGVKNAYDNKMWTKNNEKKKKKYSRDASPTNITGDIYL